MGFLFFGTQTKEKKMLKIVEYTGQSLRKPAKHPVKLTALLYLKEALQTERYEQCAEFVSVAKEFGAIDSEVRALLEDPRRRPG